MSNLPKGGELEERVEKEVVTILQNLLGDIAPSFGTYQGGSTVKKLIATIRQHTLAQVLELPLMMEEPFPVDDRVVDEVRHRNKLRHQLKEAIKSIKEGSNDS